MLRPLSLAAALGALALTAGGCISAEEYAAAAEAAGREANDISAGLLEEGPCLIRLGAWGRMTDEDKRLGAFVACVPDHERFGVDIRVGPRPPP